MPTVSFQSIGIDIVEISDCFPDIGAGIVSFYFYRYTSIGEISMNDDSYQLSHIYHDIIPTRHPIEAIFLREWPFNNVGGECFFQMLERGINGFFFNFRPFLYYPKYRLLMYICRFILVLYTAREWVNFMVIGEVRFFPHWRPNVPPVTSIKWLLTIKTASICI